MSAMRATGLAALSVLVLGGTIVMWPAVGSGGGRTEVAHDCMGAASLDFTCHEHGSARQ